MIRHILVYNQDTAEVISLLTISERQDYINPQGLDSIDLTIDEYNNFIAYRSGYQIDLKSKSLILKEK